MMSTANVQKGPLRWFAMLFLAFLVMSLPVLVLLALLVWLLYYFLSGRQPKWSLREILNKMESTFEPAVLMLACLFVAASLLITREAGYQIYAGFPFHFVTFYNFPGTESPADFWSRFAPNWNVNAMLFVNIFLYYIFIVVFRQILTKAK